MEKGFGVSVGPTSSMNFGVLNKGNDVIGSISRTWINEIRLNHYRHRYNILRANAQFRFIRNLLGEDLGPLNTKELEQLEHRLENSLKQIRSTKVMTTTQKIDAQMYNLLTIYTRKNSR